MDGRDLPLAGQVLLRPQRARDHLHGAERLRVLQAQDPRALPPLGATCSWATSTPCCSARCSTRWSGRARGLRHHELLDRGQARGAAQDAGARGRPAHQRRRGAPALGRVEHREGRARHPRHGAAHAGGEEGRARRADVHATTGSFAAPAYPLEEVFDPTGAGDTFAGGFLGYLAAQTGGGPGGHGPAPRGHHGQHARLLLRGGLQPGPAATPDARRDRRRASGSSRRLTHFEEL